MKRVFLCLSLCFLIIPSAWAETAYERVMRTGTLRCGYVAWPPFFDVEPNTGKVIGFNVDVVNGIAGFLDLRVEYIPVVVGQQVQDLNSGRVDAVCGDGPWLLGTVKYLDYAQPYYYQGSYLYGRADESRIKTLADLNQKTITFIGMDGDVSSDLAPRRFPQATLRSLSTMADSAQLLTEVVSGKADIVILDSQSADRYMKNNPGKIKLLFKNPIAVQGASFSVKKGEDDLLRMLSGAVLVALNNGLVDDVIAHYDPKHTLYLEVTTPYR